MYGLMGKIQAQAGQREALIGYLLQATSAPGAMQGCLLYVVGRATDDSDSIWVTEVWRSQAEHQDSLKHEAVQAVIAAARPLIAGMSDRAEFDPVGGIGLPVVGAAADASSANA